MQRRTVILGTLAGASSALGPALALRGFTVDDALISARYAANLAAGHGYRLNAAGPVTDGVTPLGWAHLLAPFAGSGPLAALAAAKLLGVVAWLLGAAFLGAAIARSSERPIRFAALALVAASAPLGAWSGSGMETGLIAALAALAAALPELGAARAGAACAGLAAGFRPELLPFSLVIAGAAGWAPHHPTHPASPSPLARWAWQLGLAVTPFLAVAFLRAALFGRPAPLSALAKAPDATLGARYALACFLLCGPIALLAPLAARRLAPWPRGLIAAVFTHFAAIALAGGDWMPLSRLAVPALPATALAAAHLAAVSDRRATAARFALALAGELFALVKVGPAAARVGDARTALIEALREPLSRAQTIAAVDIGWLGAAAPEATLVDLAGVTDPAIAALRGGHTTKRIPPTLLDARGVDTLVLLLREGEPLRIPWTASRFARGTELYLAHLPHIEEDFAPLIESRVPGLPYVVLRRVPPRAAD
ncbi:hypothetical protein [Chondromyces crocatus]|uniref:Glycosyltransferase RgtA/B/C/D-like domain-containing protein n=1 Tax=Chondromyces crocatus TaxID=52 RepID=A0A0K1EJE4_CHOCO|nr:hypothetical protein [Chondromyces crocatus]AKT40703.1 uncharacterized protein CMC5_048590 [Chondromyces crocatus]